MNLDKKKIINIVIYSAMSILTILLLVSVIIGSKDTPKKDQAGQKEGNENINSDEVYQYSPDVGSETNREDDNSLGPSPEELKEMQDGEIWEGSYDDIDVMENQEIDESEFPPSYEELYGIEDIKASKKIINEFVEIIHSVNGDEPMKHIEESKKYMTDELYERLQEDYKQGQMAWTYGVKQNFKSAEIYEPATTRVKDGIVWAVSVQGTIQYHDEKENDKTDIYLIHLKKIEGEYKVDDYIVNVPT